MWGVNDQARVFICLGVTDMRKSIHTLSQVVAQELGKDPVSGDLFAFCNRGMNHTKILYWNRNGFCLWQKKLEHGRFKWPQTDRDLEEVDSKVLSWLLDGLDIREAHREVASPVLV